MITYRNSFKKAAILTLAVMILNILRKLIFQIGEVKKLQQGFLTSPQQPMIIGIVLLTAVVLWLVISLILGTIYYLYKRIRES
ncbi:hypothetical protein [Companilactobacillus kimchiensis]|uniref:hypothetical protein n=1 Tax=Companilactobacillus kimchiensis TaxID=993692 RepID=UPI00070D980D|nr:hypothetical protein [Companilactobacillus kimchiensis]